MSAQRFFVSVGWFMVALVVVYLATAPLANAYYDARVAAGETTLYPKER